MSTTLVREFHKGEIRGSLTCWGGTCWFDVTCEAELARNTTQVRLEVLLQSRGADGLPQGLPRRLFVSELPLRKPTSGSGASGHVTLPWRLTADLLQSCHWRVTPITLEPLENHPIHDPTP
jgi:hypothetical protein